VVAVASRNEERARSFATDRGLLSSQGHGGCAVYGSYEELAGDAEVEAAYVGVVTSAHLPVVKILLKAGKRE